MTRSGQSLRAQPCGWAQTTLGQVVTFEYGKALTEPRRDSTGRVPVYGSNGVVGYHSTPLVQRPCLIIGRKGAVGRVHRSSVPCWPIDTTYYVVPPEGFDLGFLHYLLSALGMQALDRSTAIPGLNRDDAYALPLWVPPTHEQQRVVAKLEELFSQLDAGVAALENAKAQLQRYRQAVLKVAMTGELTTEWREAHKDQREPAPVRTGQAHQEKPRTNGKSREYPESDWAGPPSLPDRWQYLSLKDLSPSDRNAIRRGPFGSAVRKEYFVPVGYKVYEQKNVIADDFTLGSYYIDEEKFQELKAFELRSRDVVITCSGTIGKSAIAPESIPRGIINQALLKITLDEAVVLPEYFLFLFKSRVHDILRHSTRGSAMSNISSVQALKEIAFPVPPVTEQHQLLKELEYRFSITDEMEEALDDCLVGAERLRQSILNRAFEGGLVPQDPTDQPASVVLERIKAKKASREPATKQTKKQRQKKETDQPNLFSYNDLHAQRERPTRHHT